MSITTSKGLARDSVLKPGETTLSDASGVPCTPENRDRHTSEYSPTGIDDTPRLYSGVALDIDSREMPDDGVVEIHDTDEDILEVERENPIAKNAEPVR